MLAPSDMMDGRVAAIREKLDGAGFENVAVMSHATKFASAYYGPFREAADCAPNKGDRKAYQMDFRNPAEALREALLDEAEGADVLMVKPGLAYLDVIAKLKQEMQQLKFGNYADASNDFGPLISQAHKDKVQAYIQSAEQQGAKIVVDGRDAKAVGYENGFFVGPTLIDQISAEMTSYQQEIFGPVLQVIRVETMQEAMQLINDHEYGNGTCIYTRDGEAARYFTNNIQVGMVGVNVPLPVPVAYHSFGGWKRSLFGDLYAYGPDGVRFYTRRKTITQRWPSAQIREAKQFAMPTLN